MKLFHNTKHVFFYSVFCPLLAPHPGRLGIFIGRHSYHLEPQVPRAMSYLGVA